MSDYTLHHGDCLEIMPMLAAGSVDAVICDPPYGINTKSDGQGKLNPWADLMNAALWYRAWIDESRRILKQDGCMWSFLNWRSLPTFQKASFDAKWPIESLLVWDKDWIGPGGQKGLRPSYELVALWAMPQFSIPDRGIPDICKFAWSSAKPTGHPAEKPEVLLRWLVSISTTPGAIVCDPFMGSGTTGAAAMGEGRSFIGIEIDKEWHDYAMRRISITQPSMASLLFQERIADAADPLRHMTTEAA